MNNLKKVGLNLGQGTTCVRRHVQSNASLLENCVELRNRNPINLDQMTIGRKPKGYFLEIKGHEYWYKLIVKAGSKNLVLEVNHHKNGPVVTVSTAEWTLKKQLYKTLDISAYTNAGRLLAQRCLESGIGALYVDIDVEGSKKLSALVEELKKNGIALEEAPEYQHMWPWDMTRMVKPWTIVE